MNLILNILTLTMLSFSNLQSEELIDFDNKVHDAYEEYQKVETESEFYRIYDDYTIKLVRGVIDNQVRYGLYFNSDNPGDYYVNIIFNNQIYDIEENDGTVSAVVLDFKTNDLFSVQIYNKDNRPITLPYSTNFKNIKVITLEEFHSLENITTGNGLGVQTTRLKTLYQFDYMNLVYIGFGIIIALCLITLYIFYKRRMGMFNDDVKSQNIFNFKEFLNSAMDEKSHVYQEGAVISVDSKLNQKEEENQHEEQEPKVNKEVYHSWGKDEDEMSGFDIKQYLQDHGFVTNYNILDESEKNLIMLELMKLRDQKIITKDDYIIEAGELWKK